MHKGNREGGGMEGDFRKHSNPKTETRTHEALRQRRGYAPGAYDGAGGMRPVMSDGRVTAVLHRARLAVFRWVCVRGHSEEEGEHGRHGIEGNGGGERGKMHAQRAPNFAVGRTLRE